MFQNGSSKSDKDARGTGINLLIPFEYPGILAARFPIITVLLVVLLSFAAARGIMDLRADDALDGFFRSNSTVYKDFVQLRQNFPQSEENITLAVSADSFDQRETLEALRDLSFEIALADGVSSVFSIFTVRGPVETGRTIPPPLIPEQLPQDAELQKIMQDVRKNPLIDKRLLVRTANGETDLTILVVSPQQDQPLVQVVDEIHRIARQFELQSGLKIGLTGDPVIRIELARQSSKDRIIFLGLGFMVGLAVCLLFFRRLDFLIIANVPAAICVYWILAVLGASGVEINPIMTSILPLLMVISFTNAMHILFVLRSELIADREIVPAVQTAVRTVGPACFISAFTTMLAFFSIALADSELIQALGFAAAGGALLSYITVILVVPSLAVLFLRMRKSSVKAALEQSAGLVFLDRISTTLSGFVVGRSWAVSIASIVLAGLAIWLYAGLTPHYRLSDMMPIDGEARIVAEKLAESIGGTHTLNVMIFWEGDSSSEILASTVLPVIARTDAALRSLEQVKNVWSLETLKEFFVDSEKSEDIDAFANALIKIPQNMVGRLINLEKSVALTTGFTPDLEANEVVALKNTLEMQLADIAKDYPGIKFSVTGGAVLSAVSSLMIIEQLYRSLIYAILIVTLTMIITFRSIAVGFLSMVPNLFAVAATGGALYLLGWGLEYAGIIALTVAFGLAVDDTIHVFNRYREVAGASSECSSKAVRTTVQSIGPVLILTTFVLFLGICASATSTVPPTRLFGQIFMTTVVFALIGDLLMLPALMQVAEKIGIRLRR